MKIRTMICFPVYLLTGSAYFTFGIDRVMDEKPNILLIFSDDHSVPFLGCYGNPDTFTPNIDRLAEEGMIFKRAFTTAPQCVPSRASILTGRNVLDIQMLRFSAALDRNTLTLPDILRENGYYTGICGRIYHLDGESKEHMPPETQETFRDLNLITFHERIDYLDICSDEEVITRVTEFFKRKPENKPFFLWVNYSDPHRPFTAKNLEPDPEKIQVPPLFPDTRLLRNDLAGYIGEIKRLDQFVGSLISDLKDKGYLKNTIVVFMGDNGAALIRGKGTLYDYGLHVPLILWWRGHIRSGKKSDILVSGEDISPTLLDAAGFKPDGKMSGRSFLQTLKYEDTEIREFVFSVRGPHSNGLPGNSAAFDLSRTVFNKNYKLIYNPLFNLPYTPVDFPRHDFWNEIVQLSKEGKLDEKFSKTVLFSPQRPMFELFDIENDPGEFVNLSGKGEYREIEHRMKAALHRWMIIYRDVVPLPIPR